MKHRLPLIPLMAAILSAPAWGEEPPAPVAEAGSPPAAAEAPAPAATDEPRSYLDAVRRQRESLMEARREAAESHRPIPPTWGEIDRQARDAAIAQHRESMERFHEARRNNL